MRFSFADEMRADARETVARLRARGFALVLLSGDRAGATRAVAEALGIADWTAAADPKEKVARLRALAEQGKKVLMVGDGLNDAPALQSAHASLSPSAAADVAQTAADAVFQGDRLMPVAETVAVAARAARLVRQNFALSFGYNLITIPLAVLGLVTPLIAAAAMSASSLAVIGNALRVAARRIEHGHSAGASSGGAVPGPARPGRVPWWALRSGQFEDLDGAANRILFDGYRRTPRPPPGGVRQEIGGRARRRRRNRW